MKKLHKILTLCLSLIMLLGVMSMPASATYDRMYVVWTEDEYWDLSNPRPVPPEKTHIVMFIVTKGTKFDYNKGWYYNPPYRGDLYILIPTYLDIHRISTLDEVQKSAREAYDRNSDPEWKKLIADAFELDGHTRPEPETPKPTTPVTPPSTGAKPVAGFTDVNPDDWYYEAVMALANSGILAGYADGTFRPDQTITIGELATIMCRIFGLDTSFDPDIIHPDLLRHQRGHDDSTVNAGHWASTALAQMQNGSIVGSWTLCIADMELNRGKAIGLLANYISGATWPDGTKLPVLSSEEERAVLETIPDIASDDYTVGTKQERAEEASHYWDYRLVMSPEIPSAATGEQIIAQDYIVENNKQLNIRGDYAAWNAGSIATAYHIGLVSGVDSTGRCDPWTPVTRAQIVQMLYNMGITYSGQLTRRGSGNSSGIIIGMF